MGSRRLETPAFLPIVNIMTGPPPVLANGGLYRHIKVELLKERPIQGMMTQILHFTDYGIDERGLRKWLEVPISERIAKETNHRPLMFVDSGGYRFLYNTGLDLEEYKIEPTPRGIFSLQCKFGADVVATLDYPLPRGLLDIEAKDRIRRSIDNCIATAKWAKTRGDNQILIHMAVHGRTRVEARESVSHLLSRLRREGLTRIPFGLAVGSLVPLSSSPLQVIDIVRGIYEAIRNVEWLSPEELPVHAFGVSSRMMPYLAAMGVDTFDGSTYVQQAQQLRYSRPGSFSPSSFLDLEGIECHCRYCGILRKGGLDEAKQVLRSRSFGRIQYAGIETNKSYVYSLIALHNLQSSLVRADRIRKAVDSKRIFEQLFMEAAADARMRRTLAYFARFFPEISDFLWDVGVSRLGSSGVHTRGTQTMDGRMRSEPLGKGGEVIDNSRKETRPVSLELGPDDFDIMKIRYAPPARPALLILPCTQQKPYSTSPTHRFIQRVLREAGISAGLYSKVSISGNYGPVPEEFEHDPRVQAYDFYLSSQDSKRIELIALRTRAFLEKHRNRFKLVVAYCTSKAYREVIERALDGMEDAVILPTPLKARRQSQFRKPENVRQLVVTLSAVERS